MHAPATNSGPRRRTRASKLWLLLRQTVNEWIDDDLSTHAAALAYFAVFAIAPTLIIAVAIAGLAFGPEAAWVYYSALVLFLGAEFTQVYARNHGSLNPVPLPSQPAPATGQSLAEGQDTHLTTFKRR